MRALFYLEVRNARHSMAAIVRAPARLILWLLYTLALSFFAFERFTRPQRDGALASGLSPSNATTLGGLYLGALGLTAALVAGGRITVFRNPAEAIVFSNAGIRPLAIAIWLQLRKFAAGWTRLIGPILYVFVVFGPHQANGAATLRAFVATVLAIAVQLTAELPVLLLARGARYRAVRIGGWMLAGVGFAYALVGILGHQVPALAAARRVFDPGGAAGAVQRGDLAALPVLAAVIALMLASIALFGDDVLPELYAASLRRHQTVRRREAPAKSMHYANEAGASRAAHVPAGALALVWKDWIAFRRARGILQLWLCGAAFFAACGAGAAVALLAWHDRAPLVVLLALSLVPLLISAPLGAALALGDELGKPLFWLSAAPLRSRIAAWTLARSWRSALVFGVAPLAAGIVMQDVALATLALPLCMAASWSLQALGVGLYALFPNPLDSRGPMLLLRIPLTAAFSLPPALLAAALLWLHAGVAFAVAMAAAAAAAQAWAVVELAAMRFEQRGAAFATLARAT